MSLFVFHNRPPLQSPAMSEWSVDDLFVYQVFLDLWPLEEYVKIIEVELPRLIESERKNIWDGVKAGDEQQEHYAEIAEYELDEGITTRFLTGTALIAIWGTYESVTRRIARRVKDSKGLTQDMQGSSLKKVRKYYEDVLKLDLHLRETDWDRLDMINILRDALAHANGQLEYVDHRKRKKIERWVEATDGLKISGDYLIVSVEFLRLTLNFITDLLTELDNRINQLLRSEC